METTIVHWGYIGIGLELIILEAVGCLVARIIEPSAILSRLVQGSGSAWLRLTMGMKPQTGQAIPDASFVLAALVTALVITALVITALLVADVLVAERGSTFEDQVHEVDQKTWIKKLRRMFDEPLRLHHRNVLWGGL